MSCASCRYAGDAGVDAPERGDQIADVDIVRPIVAREALMRRRHVRADGAVGNDAPELPLPRMSMGVHESRDDDRIRGVDHLRLRRRLNLARDVDDLLALDQDVALHEIADPGIQADDGAAFQKQAIVRSGAPTPDALQRSGILRGLRRLASFGLDGQERARGGNRERRTGLEQTSSRDGGGRSVHGLRLMLHGLPPETNRVRRN